MDSSKPGGKLSKARLHVPWSCWESVYAKECWVFINSNFPQRSRNREKPKGSIYRSPGSAQSDTFVANSEAAEDFAALTSDGRLGPSGTGPGMSILIRVESSRIPSSVPANWEWVNRTGHRSTSWIWRHIQGAGLITQTWSQDPTHWGPGSPSRMLRANTHTLHWDNYGVLGRGCIYLAKLVAVI